MEIREQNRKRKGEKIIQGRHEERKKKLHLFIPVIYCSNS
jgi:hypothetical protein